MVENCLKLLCREFNYIIQGIKHDGVCWYTGSAIQPDEKWSYCFQPEADCFSITATPVLYFVLFVPQQFTNTNKVLIIICI